MPLSNQKFNCLLTGTWNNNPTPTFCVKEPEVQTSGTLRTSVKSHKPIIKLIEVLITHYLKTWYTKVSKK